MCTLCGALGRGSSWEQTSIGEDERWRSRQQAFATAAELSDLLAPARIRVRANPDFGFVVTFPTGASEIVTSLGEMWHLLGRREIAIPDPLDA